MLVCVIIWVIIILGFALSVLVYVVLVLGTSPVLQPNDPLWFSMWGGEERWPERSKRERDEERER